MMDFYYIADRRKPNEIKQGNKRNKFYQKKGSVKAQHTAIKNDLTRYLSFGDEEHRKYIQDEIDNLVIMVVSGEPKELEI